MKTYLHWGLCLYILLNFGLTFVLPSYRVWKQTGIFPVTFGKSDTAHDYIGNIFKVLLGLILGTGTIYAFQPPWVVYLLPIWYLQTELLQGIGLSILFIALVWIIVAQHQMANAWRIGIDEAHPTDLVTTGVFARSRNPIFLGMMLTLAGLFLILPNALTFAVLMTSFVVIQVQVRLEEAFLRASHGDIYAAYCAQTRRWF